MGESGQDQQLRALTELCRELAQLGLNVGMSDARPAVSVRKGQANQGLWITVDSSRGTFVWRRDDDQHETRDPSDAATRIAAYLSAWDAEGESG